MPLFYPEQFKLEDLNIDFKLMAWVDGKVYDFTGRKFFESEYNSAEVNTSKNYAEGIGFGIKDINMTINTSLQPIIEITFEDLYGNSIFGGNNPRNINYSSIFAWPPPKFLFSFKGYLGKSVTWILNLKKYNTSYNSSNGSYEIKATFVPNQWGFFADLPFMFLLAVKKLKKDDASLSKEEKTTIYDLIKIGKQVTIKNKETTKIFDFILKQNTSLRSNLLSTLIDSKIVKFNEEITGFADGRDISGFIPFKFEDPYEKGLGIDFEEQLSEAIGGKSEKKLTDINCFLATRFIRLDSPKKSDNYNKTFSQIQSLSDENKRDIINSVNFILDENIRVVNDEIQATSYENTKTQIGKITISEIFSQLAGDSAYLMGRILEAGCKGNFNDINGAIKNRRDLREEGIKKGLIAQNYPLTLKDGEELPATKNNTESSQDFGVENDGCEMDFVRKFIEAVTEGIADLKQIEDLDTLDSDDKIKSRITNLEALKDNPWKPSFVSFAQNILSRGAIAGFLTRSYDPNLPGDYGDEGFSSFFEVDRDDVNNIRKLAESDAKNISNNIINSIDDYDLLKLKKFVLFFSRLLSDDGDDFLAGNGVASEDFDLDDFLRDGIDITTPVSERIWNYKVVTEYGSVNKETLSSQAATEIASQANLTSGNISGFATTTLRDVMFSDSIFTGNLKYIIPSSLAGGRFINNNLPYFYYNNIIGGDIPKYYIIVFDGDDAKTMKEISSSDSDSKYKDDDSVKNVSKGSNNEYEPLGYVYIDGNRNDDGELLPKVEAFNEYVKRGLAFDYNSFKEIPQNFFTSEFSNYTSDNLDSLFKWKKQITTNSVVTDYNVQHEANNIGYIVLHHAQVQNNIIFDMFSDSDESRNQRVYIKAISEQILSKIEAIEKEKQDIIFKILGKSQEAENIIYKQMHNLFQQWNTIAYEDNVGENGDIKTTDPGDAQGLAINKMREYGGNPINIKDVGAENLDSLNNGSFIYDFPLQRIASSNNDKIKKIDVRNAIINIDPLYKPDERTTVLNMIQSICTKNSFMFIPIPGYPGFLSIKDIWKPNLGFARVNIRNFFHVVFAPTPETRTTIQKGTYSAPFSSLGKAQKNLDADAIHIKFGATDNNIVKNVQVSTSEGKNTAESIINLQRLVDNENQNKTVTSDCSILDVLGGRSYTSTVDCLGNAQVYPMQYFYLENMPLFEGLYMILEVKHSFTDNVMNTTFKGIRMRFDTNYGYGGIHPITLETLEDLYNLRRVASEGFDQSPEDDVNYIVPTDEQIDAQAYENGGEEPGELGRGEIVSAQQSSQNEVILLPNIAGFQNSRRLQTSSSDGTPIGDSRPVDANDQIITVPKKQIISSMNAFIEDVLEPFAKWLKQRYPNYYKKIAITSAARNGVPTGGSKKSQHLYGEAVDLQIRRNVLEDKLKENHELFNIILEWYRENPNKKYGQLLMETSKPNGVWIHWSYRRSGANKQERKRIVNHKSTVAPMNAVANNSSTTRAEARMNNIYGSA